MSMTFRLAWHKAKPETQMIECFRDGELVAAIYPHDDGIRIVSKYIAGVTEESGLPPSAVIKLRDR